MQKTVELKYGRRTITFGLPEERLVGVIEPAPIPPIHDVEAGLEEAMGRPLGPRLEDIVGRGSRVLVLTVDITRPSPKALLVPILRRLEALGATVQVMVGLGMHRPMTPEELREHLGTADVLQNDVNAPVWSGGTTSYGTAIEVDARVMESDVRLAVGFVEPSYLLGYTGGRKILMPGVASPRAIAHNHFLLLGPGRKLGVLSGNPLSEDALEFARTVGLHWIVDVALNPDDSYAGIFCGGMEAANEAACDMCADIYEHRLSPAEGQADIVIASAGGYPYDFDLVQTKKSVVPAMECVRPGGTIIFVGECVDGWGGEGRVSRESLMTETPDQILRDLRARFSNRDCPWHAVPCSSRYLFARAASELDCQLIAVTGINEDLATTFLDVAASVPEALAMAEARLGRDARIVIIPDGRRVIPMRSD